MSLQPKETKPNPAGENRPAPTGNASNPAPQIDDLKPQNEQTLSGKAEKYLREGGNIEDVPDAGEQEGP